MTLDRINRFGNGFRSGQIAKPPTSHGVSFGKTMHNDILLVMGLREAGPTGMFRPFIDQLFINSIANDEPVFPDENVPKGLNFRPRVERASRIARGIQNKKPR